MEIIYDISIINKKVKKSKKQQRAYMDALLAKKIANMHLENRFFFIMLTLILHACFLYLFM